MDFPIGRSHVSLMLTRDATSELKPLDEAFLDIVREEIPDVPVKRVKVTPAVDHDGDPIYDVKIVFKGPPKRRPTGKQLNRIGSRLVWELEARNDTRFPHLDVQYGRAS
ncbi:MAG: hypothetical protein HXY25_06410 [Alphaproteobacteria bacterium]|nr:hypothetical protein [Alphaproteobacteria bacterium]